VSNRPKIERLHGYIVLRTREGFLLGSHHKKPDTWADMWTKYSTRYGAAMAAKERRGRAVSGPLDEGMCDVWRSLKKAKL